MTKRASDTTAKRLPRKAGEKPLTDADLARVAGGYIGETEKNLGKTKPA